MGPAEFILIILISITAFSSASPRIHNGKFTRIFNGEQATVGQFPWQVGIVLKGTNLCTCGGTLINEEWVLTAAHCITSADEMEVLLGLASLQDTGKVQRRQVSRTKVHEKYSTKEGAFGYIQNDIPLIKLSNKADLGKNVQMAGVAASTPEIGELMTV
jgi:secreted trypsin-like serine protease